MRGLAVMFCVLAGVVLCNSDPGSARNVCHDVLASLQRGRGWLALQLLEEAKQGNCAGVADAFGRTPLHYAVVLGGDDGGGALDLPGLSQGTASVAAVEKFALDIAERLIRDFGIHVDARSKSELTPLMLAASMGRVSHLELLLKHGAELFQATEQDSTPLSLAFKYGHPLKRCNSPSNNNWKAVEFLIQQGAGRNQGSSDILSQEQSIRLPGHMQRLGAHQSSDGHIRIVGEPFMSPEQFYLLHVNASQPVLFRGLATAMEAYHLWSDAFLTNAVGDESVTVEVGKRENRFDVAETVLLKDFLSMYNDTPCYLVTYYLLVNIFDEYRPIPQQLLPDLHVTKPMLCKPFYDSFKLNLMWMSSGGTVSKMHNDDLNNMNCLLAGRKEVLLVSNELEDEVENPTAGWFQGDFHKYVRYLDVDRVDMAKFPFWAHVPYVHAHMEAGDCLFIPQNWYHQVRSFDRSLAVTLWFDQVVWTESSCQTPDRTSFNHFEFSKETLSSLYGDDAATASETEKSEL